MRLRPVAICAVASALMVTEIGSRVWAPALPEANAAVEDTELNPQPGRLGGDRNAVLDWMRRHSGYGPYLDRPADWPAALGDANLHTARVDLDGDGRPEIILTLASEDWCKWGCPAFVLTYRGQHLEKLFELTLDHAPELESAAMSVWVASRAVPAWADGDGPHRILVPARSGGWRAVYDAHRVWSWNASGWEARRRSFDSQHLEIDRLK